MKRLTGGNSIQQEHRVKGRKTYNTLVSREKKIKGIFVKLYDGQLSIGTIYEWIINKLILK